MEATRGARWELPARILRRKLCLAGTSHWSWCRSSIVPWRKLLSSRIRRIQVVFPEQAKPWWSFVHENEWFWHQCESSLWVVDRDSNFDIILTAHRLPTCLFCANGWSCCKAQGEYWSPRLGIHRYVGRLRTWIRALLFLVWYFSLLIFTRLGAILSHDAHLLS